jgi:hypothetical protein
MAEALPMSLDQAKKRMTARLVDSLYTEAMVLADEARSYFDQIGRGDREALPPIARVAFSCESLKVTTRLMHVIAWLLTRKAIAAGEIGDGEGAPESRRLGLRRQFGQRIAVAVRRQHRPVRPRLPHRPGPRRAGARQPRTAIAQKGGTGALARRLFSASP